MSLDPRIFANEKQGSPHHPVRVGHFELRAFGMGRKTSWVCVNGKVVAWAVKSQDIATDPVAVAIAKLKPDDAVTGPPGAPLSLTLVEALDDHCPETGELATDCPSCTGEACNKCGAGCWDPSVTDCTHDVLERHRIADHVKADTVSTGATADHSDTAGDQQESDLSRGELGGPSEAPVPPPPDSELVAILRVQLREALRERDDNEAKRQQAEYRANKAEACLTTQLFSDEPTQVTGTEVRVPGRGTVLVVEPGNYRAQDLVAYDGRTYRVIDIERFPRNPHANVGLVVEALDPTASPSINGGGDRLHRLEMAVSAIAGALTEGRDMDRDCWLRDALHDAGREALKLVCEGAERPTAREALLEELGDARETLDASEDRAEKFKADADKWWKVLCEASDELGGPTPEKAPHVPAWIRRLNGERDALIKIVEEVAAHQCEDDCDDDCLSHRARKVLQELIQRGATWARLKSLLKCCAVYVRKPAVGETLDSGELEEAKALWQTLEVEI